MQLKTMPKAPAARTGAAPLCAAALAAVLSLHGVSAAADKAALPAFELSAGRPLLSQAASTGAVVGQGGNSAVALPDGRTLWLLNNVMTGERKADGQSSVWYITDGAAAFAASTAPAAQPGALKYASDENGLPLRLLAADPKDFSPVRRYWPRAGLCRAGRCVLFYSVLNQYGDDPYEFFRVGQGVAVAAAPEGPYSRVPEAGRSALWSDIQPAFGSALLEDADGWVYIYGRQQTAPGEYGAALARARAADLAVPGKYQYYAGGSSSSPWTSDLADAVSVLDGAPEDFSVSYNERLKAYLAVQSDEEGGRVLARTARWPWGPWSEPAALLACAKDDYCFGAKEQPAFAADNGGRIYLTVEKKNAPYLYEVRFK